MTIVRNKVILLVSQSERFSSNQNTMAFDYIVVRGINVSCNTIINTACSDKGSKTRTIYDVST